MATISFNTTFDLTVNPKQFIFVDSSDYAGQGIALANVNGSFKIYAPSGTLIYNNTDYTSLGCDINIVVSTTNQTVIQLPLGLGGFPEEGVYTVTYTVYDSNLLIYSTITNTYTYAYVQPEVVITQTVDDFSPLFTSTDATNYVVNGITPVVTRVHTINFPFGSAGEGSPIIGSAATITTSTFYNGTQTTEIESELVYAFADGLVVLDTVTGVEEVLVDATEICGIYCGIRSIEQGMMVAATTNTSTYATLKSLFSQIMGLVGMVQLAKVCGKGSDVSGYLTAIRELGNFTDDCNCSGDQPTQVVGLGSLINNVVVESAGSPLTVTPVTVGNTTTYTISFDTVLLTKLNNLYNTVLVAGNNTSITDSGVIAGVRTYTINGVTASVVAGSNISVTAGAPISGVTPYTVTSSIANLNDYVGLFLPLTNGVSVPDPDISVVVPSTGTYLILAKFSVSQDDLTTNILSVSSTLTKDGGPIANTTVAVNVSINSSATTPEIEALSNIVIAPLTSGQIVSMEYTAAAINMSTLLRSISLIKIA